MLEFQEVVDVPGQGFNVFDESGVYVGEVRKSHTGVGWVFSTTLEVTFTEGVLFQIWGYVRKLDQELLADTYENGKTE